jgi:hypothetical protein
MAMALGVGGGRRPAGKMGEPRVLAAGADKEAKGSRTQPRSTSRV